MRRLRKILTGSAPFLFICVLSICLRFVSLGGVPFQHADDISTVWATSFYYPRGIASFRMGDGSLEPNPLGILTVGHGPLQVLISLVCAWISSVLGIRLTEVAWHLPFAAIGGLTTVMAYAIASGLQGRRAGLISALFVATLPLHVAFSRTSGESHYILASMLQLLSLYFWTKYLATMSSRFALWTGLSVAADMLTDLSFPALLLTLSLLTGAHVFQNSPERKLRWIRIAKLIADWRLLLPMLVPSAIHAWTAWETLGRGNPVGMFGRILSEGSSTYTRVGGLFVRPFLENLSYGSNTVFLVLILGLLIVYIYQRSGLGRNRCLRRSLYPQDVFAIHIACYSAPLIFLFSRGRLIGHFIPIGVSLCIFAAFGIDRWLDSRSTKQIARVGCGATTVAFALTVVSTVFGVPMPDPFHRPIEHGGVGIDFGTKAAAFWVRANTPAGAVLFTDSYAGQSLPLNLYYYHRPVVSDYTGPETSPDTEMKMLMANLPIIDVIVLGSEQFGRIPKQIAAEFRVSAEVLKAQGVSLYIMTRRQSTEANQAAEVLSADIYNDVYDRRYASLDDIIDLPLEAMRRVRAQRQ